MLQALLLICLSLSGSLPALWASSAERLNRAEELLRDQKAREALVQLEKAFEISQDPQEIERIAVLIIEASPSDYPKREAYLRYLVSRPEPHENIGHWLKELGDRALANEEYLLAEDWYLRASRHLQKPAEAERQLGLAYSRQGQHIKAFEKFLDVISMSSAEENRDLFEELSQLWKKIGPLPSPSFNRLFSELEKPTRSRLIQSFLDGLKESKSLEPQQLEQSFLQLKSNPEGASALQQKLSESFVIRSQPCLLFERVLESNWSIHPETLLSCLNDSTGDSSTPVDQIRMLEFLEAAGIDNERVVQSAAEILIRLSRHPEAIEKMMAQKDFSSRSSKFIEFLESTLIELHQSDFEVATQRVPQKTWERLVDHLKSTAVLKRLESIDSERWLQYQEDKSDLESRPKDLLIRRAIQIVETEPTDWEQLETTLAHLFQRELNSIENALRNQFSKLRAYSERSLPRVLNEDFQKKYSEWIKDLDEALSLMAGSSEEWKKISRPWLAKYIGLNVEALEREITAAGSDPTSHLDEFEFEESKDSLKSELRRRYSSFVKSAVQAPSIQAGSLR